MALSIAVAALQWGLRFYLHHWPIVLGLSLVPAAQRLLITWPDLDVAPWLSVTSEVVAQLSRVALLVFGFVLMTREVFPDRPPLSRLWAHFTAGIDRNMRAFLLQFLILAAAFAIFDLIPNVAISVWVPAENKELVTSWVIAGKNPTVIAMTFLWMIGLARGFMLLGTQRDSRLRPSSGISGVS